jgi:pimeloyl-ACP methyl ester carboxylesterase
MEIKLRVSSSMIKTLKMMKKLSLLIAFVVLFSSCNDGENDIVKKPEVEPRLVNAELVFTRKADETRNFISMAGLDISSELFQYDIEMWEVEYSTTYKDQQIVASGLVFIPEKEDRSPVASFQHGTIASNAEAPTELSVLDGQIVLQSALASMGVITVVPDFIGFGSSKEIMHPYYVEKPSADAIIDNLRAAVELAVQNEYQVSSRLYLAGYSQGGYMTMAAHKAIEEQGIEFFVLQASYPASGGYDIVDVRDFFFEQESYSQPFFLAYVAEAYRTYYDEDEFLSIFQEPYASSISSFFDGTRNGGQINNELTTIIADLVVPEYLADPNATEYEFITKRFEENSLIDWAPQIEMAMYHGDADITVPYRNSVLSYDRLLENGASTNVVTFTTIPGGNHGSAILPYIESILQKLIEQENF